MLTLFQRLWPFLAALAACAFIFYEFDWPNMLAMLPELPLGWLLLVLSTGALFVFAICAARWIAISQLPWLPSVMLRVHCYVSLSIVASLVTPFQLGELIKIRFAQKTGLKLGNSAFNVALERILDLMTIAAMGVAGLLYLRTGLSLPSIVVLIGVFLAGLAVPSILSAFANSRGDTKFGNRARALVGPPLPFQSLLIVGTMTVLKWGLTLATWMLTLELANVDLTIWQGSFLVGAVTAISIISMIPGGLGVQELSVRAILISIGIEPLQAETAALALRLFTPIMVLVGVAHLPLLYKYPHHAEGKSLDV